MLLGISETTGRSAHYVWNGITEPRPISNVSTSSVAANTYFVLTSGGIANSSTASLRSKAYFGVGSAEANNTVNSATSTGNARMNLTIGYAIGYNFSGNVDWSSYAALDVSEILIYSSELNQTDRESIRNFLISKWSL